MGSRPFSVVSWCQAILSGHIKQAVKFYKFWLFYKKIFQNMLMSMWFQSQIHPSFDTSKLLILKLQNDTLQTSE